MTVEFAALFLLFSGTSIYATITRKTNVPISTVLAAQAGIVLILGFVGTFVPALSLALMGLLVVGNFLGKTPILS